MIRKILQAPFRYQPWKPAHARLIAADLLGVSRQPAQADDVHLRALVDWLCRAQDQRKGCADEGSVSAGWSFEDGWLQGYPETSGYIIETFLAAADGLNRPELRTRASRIVDWELSIQNKDGSFPGHFGESGSRPVIFNTGQIMHGMVAGYLELGRDECLVAAVNAANWMIASQDEDGCWRRNVHNGVPHTYNTRAAWALLRTGLMANDARIIAAARRNIEWALTQQTASGWFRTNGFTAEQIPFTHTIAYAIRGVLECGVLLDEARYVEAALKAARGLAAQQRADGFLAGTYGDGWVPNASYCCLTGVAQSALNWLRFDQHTGSGEFTVAVDRGLDYLKKNHRITGTGAPEDGGVAGSAPIWGRYSMFEYPNWAAKFFADALLIRLYGHAVPATDRGRRA
ncbi:MAG: terpene cyclase/mutase family protein [Gammaproteobacteria bacterium]|nr:terpene cyclase/mutase family protein [Gammaproteobacteria bacterium]